MLNLSCNNICSVGDGLLYNTKLISLNLSYNNITKITGIGHLKTLRNLNLSHNKLAIMGVPAAEFKENSEHTDGDKKTSEDENTDTNNAESTDTNAESFRRMKITEVSGEESEGTKEDEGNDEVNKKQNQTEKLQLEERMKREAERKRKAEQIKDEEELDDLNDGTGRKQLKGPRYSLLKELLKLPKLANVDLSWNQFDAFTCDEVRDDMILSRQYD
jgi:Leucine-rich repeat (LRR) protein